MCGHGECVGIQNKLDSVALVGRVALQSMCFATGRGAHGNEFGESVT